MEDVGQEVPVASGLWGLGGPLETDGCIGSIASGRALEGRVRSAGCWRDAGNGGRVRVQVAGYGSRWGAGIGAWRACEGLEV